MHQHPPTFSIIIPTHNRARLTVRAVDSALANGSCGSLEVLVIDDASSDDSLDLLGMRYAGNPRVRLLSMPRNRGPSAARNMGMKEATGRFLLFLDSDDILLPNALAFARAAFEKAPEMHFLGLEGEAINVRSGVRLENIQQKWNPGWQAVHLGDWPSRTLQVSAPESMDAPPATLLCGDLSAAIQFGDLFFLSGAFLRLEAARTAGLFNERFRLWEDWEFMARVCQIGPGGYLVQTGFCREHGRADQLSAVTTQWRFAVMHQRVLDTIRAAGGAGNDRSRWTLRRAQAVVDYQLGRCLLQQRRYRQARSRFARSLSHMYKPFKSLVWLVGSRLAPGPSKRLAAR